MDATLVQTLSFLEAQLQSDSLRGDALALQALLHPDFEEIGRSGRRYSRQDMLAALLAKAKTHAPTIVADNYAASWLAPSAALLTYRSAERQSGRLTRQTWRGSIWLQVGERWQLRHHQGTATGE